MRAGEIESDPHAFRAHSDKIANILLLLFLVRSAEPDSGQAVVRPDIYAQHTIKMSSHGRIKPNEWNLYLGKSFDGSLAAKGEGETYETLRYTFKPDSVKNKPGTLWKEVQGKEGVAGKVYVELVAGEQDSTSHTFEGQCTAKKDFDCVLILDSTTGRARLERLAGSTR